MRLILPKAGITCPGGTLVSQRKQATLPVRPAKMSCNGATRSRPAYKAFNLLHVPNKLTCNLLHAPDKHTVASTLGRHLSSILDHNHRRAGLLGHAERQQRRLGHILLLDHLVRVGAPRRHVRLGHGREDAGYAHLARQLLQALPGCRSCEPTLEC